MLESWKEKDLLRSSDDASHIGAEASEETSTSKSTKISDKTTSTSSSTIDQSGGYQRVHRGDTASRIDTSQWSLLVDDTPKRIVPAHVLE
jgi:hypothetical protein